MKKLIALALLLAAVSAQAQTRPAPAPAPESSKAQSLPLGVQAVGWDDALKHITARIGLSQNNAVDIGVGLNINTATDEEELLLGGFYLLKLQDWGIVDNYLIAGASAVLASEVALTGFAGLQPEITLLDRIIVSVKFGLSVPIVPDFAMVTAGSPISIVEGFNFKVIW
jgi:hypothetical protein